MTNLKLVEVAEFLKLPSIRSLTINPTSKRFDKIKKEGKIDYSNLEAKVMGMYALGDNSNKIMQELSRDYIKINQQVKIEENDACLVVKILEPNWESLGDILKENSSQKKSK